MKQTILLFLLIIQVSFIKAQDILVAVKKGTVTINGTKVTSKSLPKKVSKSTHIHADQEAILLLNKGSKYNKIYCPCEDLSYADITKKLGQQSVKGNSTTQVIFNKPIEKEGGAQKGVVSRGENEDQTFYINIEDSSVIYSTDFTIEWQTPTEINYSSLPKLRNLSRDDIQELTNLNKIEVASLLPGKYELSFEGTTTLNKQLVNIKLLIPFEIPSSIEKEKIDEDIRNLKAATIDLGEDIYKIYLEEFLLLKHIVGY